MSDVGSMHSLRGSRRQLGTRPHRLIWALVAVTPLGLVTKFAAPEWIGGVVGRWCHLYGAAVLYEVFWVLVLKWLAHGWPVRRCALVVFVVTCGLEFLQLAHTPALDAVRNTFVGAALLGNGFDWWDFPHYVIGSIAGGLLAWCLGRRRQSSGDDQARCAA